MFLSQISFGPCPKGCNSEALAGFAEEYLAASFKNGQILGDYLFAWCDGRLVAYTHVARPDSLDRCHHSQWGVTQLDAVAKAFGRTPECHVLEDGVPKRFRNWERAKSLYIFTTALDEVSPVCCGDTGSPIPLYLLPVPDRQREDLYFWAKWYRNLDHVWLASGALEMPAYKELADPTSEHSVMGRESCADIERATHIPTYYFVHRYWGRAVGESTRACPLCGGKWHVRGSAGPPPFHQFEFRCRRCRLVSHGAASFDDERHARIGEYRKKNSGAELFKSQDAE